MALVICPECKKEVSSFAESCPHCGFPLIKFRNSNTSYNVVLVSYQSKLSAVALIKELRHISLADAKEIADNIPAIIVSNVAKSKADEIKNRFDAIDAVAEIQTYSKHIEKDAIEAELGISPYSVVLISINGREYNASKAFAESVSIPYKEESLIIAHAPSIIKSNLTKDEAQSIYDIFNKRGIIVKIIDNPEDLKHYWVYKEEPELIDDGILRCPHCKSTAITTGSRGYSLLWGFLGSGSTVNRCGKCGHTWKP